MGEDGQVFGFNDWLVTLPPLLVFVLVGLIIMIESIGIPLPGELTLISAALLAATGGVSIWGVAIAASTGAIIGDSIGYYVGHRGGRPLLERLGQRFPKHFGPPELARAEQTFAKWGVWAVFFGRFVALLRILAGPLAGALRVPYRRFLAANAAGGIVWSFGTAFTIYKVGQAAERYLKDFSWAALVVALLFGLATTAYLRRRAARAEVRPTPAGEVAAVAVHAATDAPAAAVAGLRTGRPHAAKTRRSWRRTRR